MSGEDSQEQEREQAVESAVLAEPGAQEGQGLLQVMGLLAVADKRTSLV